MPKVSERESETARAGSSEREDRKPVPKSSQMVKVKTEPEPERNEDPVSGEEEDEDEEGEIFPVSCGNVTAKFHHKQFLCPGIHQECIELEGGVFVTPKAFSVMGEKAKLKDWKNAIRVNGKSIRRRMDRGELDFYRHSEICTGRCASRNGGLSKYDMKIESLKAANESASWDLAPTFVPLVTDLNESAFTILREVQGESPDNSYTDQSPGASDSTTVTRYRGKGLGQIVFPSPVPVDCEEFEDPEKGRPSSHASAEEIEWAASMSKELAIDEEAAKFSDIGTDKDPNYLPPGKNSRYKLKHLLSKKSSKSGSGDMAVSVTGIATPYLINGKESKRTDNPRTNSEVLKVVKMVADFPDTENLLEDSVSFWQSIKDLSLMDDMFRDIKQAIDCIRLDMVREGIREDDAQKLSKIVTDLGLVTKLKWRIAENKTKTEMETERLNNQMEALKRKMLEAEERQRDLKRKSERFDQFICKNRSKRPNLDLPESSRSGSSTTHVVSAQTIEPESTVITPDRSRRVLREGEIKKEKEEEQEEEEKTEDGEFSDTEPDTDSQQGGEDS